MKDIDVSKLDWSQLNVDASTLTGPAPKGSGAPKGAGGADTAWSANEKANGTSAVSVKQSITPFWDTRIGADMTVARQGTATTSELLSEKLANGGSLPQSSGTAWAAITAPGVASIWDKTSVEARVDPGSGAEQARHLLEQVAAAQRAIFADPAERLQSDPAGHRAGARHRQPSGAQLRDRPVGEAQHRRHRHQSASPARPCRPSDDKWLRKVGAEQKLFDGVTISGSIGETPSGAANKSLSAGFKRSW